MRATLHVMQIDRQGRKITIKITINMFRVETSLLAGVRHLLLISRSLLALRGQNFRYIYTYEYIYYFQNSTHVVFLLKRSTV